MMPFRSLAAVALATLAAACATAPATPSASTGVDLRSGLEAAEHRRDTDALHRLAAYLSQPDLPVKGAEQAIGTLITIDLARGDYDHAARAWERMDVKLRAAFSDDTAQTAAVAIALRAEKPPRMEGRATPVDKLKDGAGLVRVPARFGSADVDAVIDTGANLSVATAALAKRAGLRVLPATVKAGAATGATVDAHVAIGDIALGGATFRNAAILVVADEALAVSPTYKLDAIIGFPQLASSGRVRFSPNDILLGAPEASGKVAPIEMRGLDVYVDATIDGAPVTLHLDTGARSTTLGPHAAKALGDRIKDAKFENRHVGGAGGAVETKRAELVDLPIRVGDAIVTLDADYAEDGKQLSVADDTDGRLGQDFYGVFGSYTIDFDAMTIGFSKP